VSYPETVRDRDDVVTREHSRTVDATAYEAARSRAETIEGGVAVGVTDADDRLLVIRNDWADGWLLPGGGVEPGEDWERAAVREVYEETGVTVTVDRPVCVGRGHFRNAESGTTLPAEAYVVFAATPTDGTTLAADPGVDDEDIRDVAWFHVRPDDVHDREQLELFLDG
jgi:ADP-ribose pyrophosphatase YjhB (NUDIX family)